MHDAEGGCGAAGSTSSVEATTRTFLAAVDAHAAGLRAGTGFPGAVAFCARALVDHFIGRPIVVRFTGTHARFLTVATLFILHHRADPQDSTSGATLTRISARLAAIGGASRNTIAAQMAELQDYGWVETSVSPADRRVRRLTPTDQMVPEMGKWTDAYLGGLDRLDGGQRCAASAGNARVQAGIAQVGGDVLLAPDGPWVNVHPAIERVIGREGGFLLLMAVLAAIESVPDQDGRIAVPDIRLDAVADGLGVSRRHLRDLLVATGRAGDLGLAEGGAPYEIWIAADFRDVVFDWLSRQFAALDLVSAYVLAGLKVR